MLMREGSPPGGWSWPDPGLRAASGLWRQGADVGPGGLRPLRRNQVSQVGAWAAPQGGS